MLFESRSEAYTHVISELTILNKESENKAIIDSIAKIKAIFENHTQKHGVVVDILTELKKILPEKNNIFDDLISSFNENPEFLQSDKERFSNPLARRFESELAVLLLTEPTDAMMLAVKQVSDQILTIINKTTSVKYKSYYNGFLKTLQDGGDMINCGAYKEKVTMEEVKKMLSDNYPKDLATIMNIHFKFAHGVSRYVPNDVACHNSPLPLPKLESILKTEWKDDDLKAFFSDGIRQTTADGRRYRSCIDQYIYNKSPLFTAEAGRGRLGNIQPELESSQYGIMLLEHEKLSVGLHSTPDVAWVPDARAQKPKLDSQYVKDLIYNDAPYVAGPSGMTTLLLGLGLTIGNFSDVSSVQLYLAAIAAYVVGGGFHSFHEVIGLAEESLGLIPGYLVSAPVAGKTAAPPNYQVFFDLLAQINPDFSDIREKAWDNYLEFYKNIYSQNIHVDLVHEEQQAILESINNGIKIQSKPSLTMFPSEEKIELNYAKQLQEQFSTSTNCRKLLNSVKKIRELYNSKTQPGVDQKFSDEGNFNHFLNELCDFLEAKKDSLWVNENDESDDGVEETSSNSIQKT